MPRQDRLAAAGPAVLIPVNRLDRAKGRLAALLAPEERAGLVRRTLATVLEATAGAGLEAVVLSADAGLRASLPAGTRALAERPDAEGLSAQLERAAAALARAELLILHADLPLATAGALRDFVGQAPPAPSATLARSADGGTNALLLRPPGRFALAYGPGSADRHEAAARASGMAVRHADAPALALDLDTPADARRLLATPAGRATAAGRYLAVIGVEGRDAFRAGD